jgi:hypothetical protein
VSYENELQNIHRVDTVIDADMCGTSGSASFYTTKDKLYKILILIVNKNDIFGVKKSFLNRWKDIKCFRHYCIICYIT